jgi:hypothetical protein
VVGLNFENVDRASFLVEMSPKNFLKTTGDVLHDVWEFNRRKDSRKATKHIIWVLKTHDTYRNSVVLTVGSVLENENKSIIGAVAYHVGPYGISVSKTASEMRKSIIRDINGLLAENSKPSLVPTDGVDDTISRKAYTHALSVTRSKTEIASEFFRNIDWYYRFAIIFTGIAFSAVTYAYTQNFLDLNAYVGAVVVVVIAFVFEFGISLREEWERREIEEID